MKKVIYIVLLALVPMAITAQPTIGGQGLYEKYKAQQEKIQQELDKVAQLWSTTSKMISTKKSAVEQKANETLMDLQKIGNDIFQQVQDTFMGLTKPADFNKVTVEELKGLVYKLNGYATNSKTGIPLAAALQPIFDSVKNDYRAIVVNDNKLLQEQGVTIQQAGAKTRLTTDTPNAKQFIQSLLYQIVTGFKLPQFTPSLPVKDMSGNIMYIQGL